MVAYPFRVVLKLQVKWETCWEHYYETESAVQLGSVILGELEESMT